MGPWRPVSSGRLAYNPYTWSKLANMVYIEQPIGVGFSFDSEREADTVVGSVEAVRGTDGQVPFGDHFAIKDMVKAMQLFFERYPERLGNPVYIASESYGGHYVPELTLALLNIKPEADRHGVSRRFRGFMLGNPYTSFASSTISMANLAWGLQLLPRPLW
jgi:carboxypeptidase C (cathepsin A)